MRPVQYFSDEYLEACKKMSPDQIVEFLESFRLMHEKPAASKLISMRVPEPLLAAFRKKCEIEGVRYQTKIKMLMEEWL
ncbi:MAG: hypothetical protein ACR2RB_01455 [Gammaproteobacteria bacterium]